MLFNNGEKYASRPTARAVFGALVLIGFCLSACGKKGDLEPPVQNFKESRSVTGSLFYNQGLALDRFLK